MDLKYIRNVGNEPNKQLQNENKAPEVEIENIQNKRKLSSFSINRWMLIKVMAGIALFLLISIILVVKVNDSLNNVQNLQKQLTELKHKNEIMKSEINSLESPERITVIAKEKIGLIQPNEVPKFLQKTESKRDNE